MLVVANPVVVIKNEFLILDRSPCAIFDSDTVEWLPFSTAAKGIGIEVRITAHCLLPGGRNAGWLLERHDFVYALLNVVRFGAPIPGHPRLYWITHIVRIRRKRLDLHKQPHYWCRCAGIVRITSHSGCKIEASHCIAHDQRARIIAYLDRRCRVVLRIVFKLVVRRPLLNQRMHILPWAVPFVPDPVRQTRQACER